MLMSRRQWDRDRFRVDGSRLPWRSRTRPASLRATTSAADDSNHETRAAIPALGKIAPAHRTSTKPKGVVEPGDRLGVQTTRRRSPLTFRSEEPVLIGTSRPTVRPRRWLSRIPLPRSLRSSGALRHRSVTDKVLTPPTKDDFDVGDLPGSSRRGRRPCQWRARRPGSMPAALPTETRDPCATMPGPRDSRTESLGAPGMSMPQTPPCQGPRRPNASSPSGSHDGSNRMDQSRTGRGATWVSSKNSSRSVELRGRLPRTSVTPGVSSIG